jgi:two-component system sensor histidine kinase BarA
VLRRLSLANKCLLLFGGAIVAILLAALTAPYFRMSALVDDGQLEISRQMVSMWEKLDDRFQTDPSLQGGFGPTPGDPTEYAGVNARRLSVEQADGLAKNDPFLRSALDRFRSDPERLDYQSSTLKRGSLEYRYAKAYRTTTQEPKLESIVILDRRSLPATGLILLNFVFLVEAFIVVLALSLILFYQITHRLILRPVRDLKDTAQKVRDGDIATRSSIRTGDEFQELAESFNLMLSDLQSNQDQLRAINNALDLKLHELAQSNDALYEAAKLKGEFLASVSHELRTPLNSIIGFAELLLDIARAEQAAQTLTPALQPSNGEPVAAVPAAAGPIAKRIRYLENIVNAGRNLLEMINSLLEMAKLEAGKVEVKSEPMSMRDACEGLIALIAPLAEKKNITLHLDTPTDIPLITTDVKKFQQVVFNFLSNAVKFTDPPERSGRPAVITLDVAISTERTPICLTDGRDAIRISVIDTGRGIPAEKLPRVFDKFYQVDSSISKEHAGTGLGLAISRELATLLQGEVTAESAEGVGSIFTLLLPFAPDEALALNSAERQAEARFRANLVGHTPAIRAQLSETAPDNHQTTAETQPAI